MLEEFAKSIMLYAKGVVQNRCDVILSKKTKDKYSKVIYPVAYIQQATH